MTDVTRRTLATAAALAGLGLATRASADQPPDLLGKAEGGKIELPDLYAPSEVSSPPPQPDPHARRLGVAVVGLGHLSLEQILPGFGQARSVRLAALVSGERDKVRAVAAQHGVDERHLYDYATFDRLRDDPDVDIVYIVLPNNMHMEYTVRAAQAGKHVLCEKPMATSVADAERMIAACRDAKRLLMIAYRMQYDPYHRELIRMARSGEHGRVRLIEAVNGQNEADIPQWRHFRDQAGGGSLPDVGLYCLNAARYVTGEEPVEITAQTTQPADDPRFREIEDMCAFTLRFPSGTVANCTSGYSFHENRQMRVMMDAAWVGLDPAFSYEGLRMRIGRKAGRAHAVEQRTYSDRNQFAREMDHFAECIRAGKQPHTPGEEGAQDMRLIAAIYQAAQQGSPVGLPAVQGLDTTRGPAPAEEG
jgi:predicted dehydrogenase